MKLLITGALKCTHDQICEIEKMGYTCCITDNEKADIPADYKQAEGIICNGFFLYHDIKEFKNLKFIQLTSAGFDRVPMEYIKKHDIRIYNASGVYSIPMAEFAVGGVLQIYKQSKFFLDNQKKHKWEKRRDLLELYGKKVCVAGCGSVGSECAKRFKAFGCKVIGVDLKALKNDDFDIIFTPENLGEALLDADIIILTLPLTSETVRFIDKRRFSVMKKGAVIVNIARGGIVDTKALAEALQNNIGGAVLDVFEDEPLGADSPLWDMENVIITPHISFVGEGNRDRLYKAIKNNIQIGEK